MSKRKSRYHFFKSSTALLLSLALTVSMMVPLGAIPKLALADEAAGSTVLSLADTNGAFAKVSDGTTAGKVGTVSAGGAEGGVGQTGYDYDLIRMYYSYENQERANVLFYSDGLFDDDPRLYNEHLATASWALAVAGGYLNKDEEPSAYNNVSYNKHAAGRQFLADIGCPDESIYISNDNRTTPNARSIGMTMGNKELTRADGTKTGDILVPITIRGIGYDLEWVSNVTLGPEDEASGFYRAASRVMTSVKGYLEDYGLTEAYQAGRVKFWVTGYSRAGATANILAKELVEKIASDGCDSKVFCYTCEAPKGGTDLSQKLRGKNYYCIHNMINKVDIVPYVAPEQMGFKRYGVDHYIPGTDAYTYSGSDAVFPNDWKSAGTDEEIGDTGKKVHWAGRSAYRHAVNTVMTVTTYCDNLYVSTKTDPYYAQREKMLAHLGAMDPSASLDDGFQPYTLDVIRGMNMHSHGYSDDRNRVEIFVEDFINFVQVGLRFKHRYDESQQMVRDRQYYVTSGLEDAARTLMEIAQGEEGVSIGFDMDRVDMPMFNIGTLFSFFGGKTSMAKIFLDCIHGWAGQSYSSKQKWYSEFWNLAKQGGMFDDMSPGQLSQLSSVWNVLVDRVLTLVYCDYAYSPFTHRKEGPVTESDGFVGYHKYNDSTESLHWAAGSESDTMMYLPTLLQHMEYIVSCHQPSVNIAWTRSYDSWYDGETANYAFTRPSEVAAPAKAYATNTRTGKKVELIPGEDASNELSGEQMITFECEDDVVGKAIYTWYDTDKEPYYGLYSKGERVYPGNNSMTWHYNAFAMSYGVKSDVVKYNVTAYTDNHRCFAVDPDVGYQHEFAAAKDGETVTFSLPDSWYDREEYESVYIADVKPFIYDREDTKVDVTNKVKLSIDPEGSYFTCTLPEANGDDLPFGYNLYFDITFAKDIEKAAVNIAAPVAGQPLQEYAEVTFGDNETVHRYPIAWMYREPATEGDGTNSKLVRTSGTAYQDTEYFATVRMEKGRSQGIVFAESVNATLTGGGEFDNDFTHTGDGPTTDTLERNAKDGFIDFTAAFEKTGTEDGSARPNVKFELEIAPISLNTNEPINEGKATYLVEQGKDITITAPDLGQKRFMFWEAASDTVDAGLAIPEGKERDKTITLTIPSEMSIGQTLILRPYYSTIVTKVDVQIEAPKPGEALAIAADHLRFTLEGEYEIDPAYVKVEWLPASDKAPGTAAYLTQHTAAIKLAPVDGFIEVKQVADAAGNPVEDAESEMQNAFYPYADDLKLASSAESDEQSARIVATTFDITTETVYVTFSATNYELSSVRAPEPVYDVPYGATAEEIQGALPTTTVIKTKNGLTMNAETTWTKLEPSSADDERSAIMWTARGKIILPDSVDDPDSDRREIPVMNTVYVNEAAHAMHPIASLPSDVYAGDQKVTLSSSEKNGTTYYTIDGSDPTTDSPVYKGETIDVSRNAAHLEDELVFQETTEEVVDEETGETETLTTGTWVPSGRIKFVIKAYTVVDGKWDSSVMTYEYVFDDKAPVPQDAEASDAIPAEISAKKPASLAAVEKAIASTKAGKEVKGSTYAPLKLQSKKQGKKSIKLTWGKAKGAKKYVVYAATAKGKYKKLKTVKGKKLTVKKVKGKKLKKGTTYRFVVAAVKGSKVVALSKCAYVATAGKKKNANPTKVTVAKKVLTKAKKLKKGKSLKLKAKVKKKKGTKVKKHLGVRYESTNKKVVTVSKKGKLKAKKKGKAYVYAYAQNGIAKKVKVVVK